MKIAIVGAGGIGGYLAAKLIEADEDVALLARGAQLEAIRATGLTLKMPDGDLTVTPPVLTDDPAALGTPDLIVLAVKAHQLGAAIEQIAPAVGPKTRLLPFQNGVDAPEMLATAFGRERALIGVARIFINITGPGEITFYGRSADFTIGTLDGAQSPVRAVIERFRAAGIGCPDHPDVRIDLWTKFLIFNAVSCTTAGARARVGQIRAHPEGVALARRLMQEVRDVAVASGVQVPAEAVERTLKVFVERLPDEARASTAHDLDEGRALEIDHTCGALARRGRALGVDVTASETIYALLLPWREGG